ncbi:MAG: hypothetical protein HYY06_13450 [Deltaproteobacteria bacterium]|nr:hypothetical protein [Deltaproteobacteria bacterium]
MDDSSDKREPDSVEAIDEAWSDLVSEIGSGSMSVLGGVGVLGSEGGGRDGAAAPRQANQPDGVPAVSQAPIRSVGSPVNVEEPPDPAVAALTLDYDDDGADPEPNTQGATEEPALTLDLAEMEHGPASGANDPDLAMDLTEFLEQIPSAAMALDSSPPLGSSFAADQPAGGAESLGISSAEAIDALSAVEEAGEAETTASRMERDMRARFEVGDFTGALEAAEWLLRDRPGHEEAVRYAASCRDVLLQMYVARIGALDRIPSVAVSPSDLPGLGLDHRAGFILSCVDGVSSFSDILDVSGMPELESYRILCDLLLANVIRV